MDYLLELNLWLHIAAGFIGLGAFWVPVFSRKGSPLHKSAGKVFRYSAILVVAAAGISVVVRITDALVSGVSISDNVEGWSFLIFLGYIALITGVILSHGIAVLHHKSDLTELNTLYRRFSAWTAIFASLFIVGWAIYWQPDNSIVLYALSPIGILNGWSILKVIGRSTNHEPRKWLLEHLNAMLGCGIAFHTAFAVFGMGRVLPFDLAGIWQVLPWVLPALVGIPATSIWVRKYRTQTTTAIH